MKEKEFNLLDEPWIRVLRPDCTIQEVSMTDALIHADEFMDLSGELPTQDAAVLRLLLAVLFTVFSRTDADGEEAPIETADDALERWGELWQAGRIPEKPVRDYLAQWHERFWLFHPQRPFYQVPEAAIGTEYTAAKLNGEILESGNKTRLFSVYSGTDKSCLSYAQAARWLLYINGYDDTSAKPKGKGLPSVGAGWLGKIGLLIAKGKNLAQTLLLNLTLLQDGEALWGAQNPIWELAEPRSGERIQIAQPDNPAQLYTLQSRRILLHRQGDRVDGYRLLGGDFFEPKNAFCEQMTLWRKGKESKNAPLIYTPRRHDPSSQFWREFPTAFDGQDGGHLPGITRWIAALQKVRLLDKKNIIRFSVVGAVFGDKDFFINDTFSDSLTFHLSLLSELGRACRIRVIHEIQLMEKLAMAVGYLAQDIDRAAGSEDDSDAARAAREQFYFRVDQPFRDWLFRLEPNADMDVCVSLWRKEADKICLEIGKEMINNAGPGALVGKVKKQEGKAPIFYSAAKAYKAFLNHIRTIIGQP